MSKVELQNVGLKFPEPSRFTKSTGTQLDFCQLANKHNIPILLSANELFGRETKHSRDLQYWMTAKKIKQCIGKSKKASQALEDLKSSRVRGSCVFFGAARFQMCNLYQKKSIVHIARSAGKFEFLEQIKAIAEDWCAENRKTLAQLAAEFEKKLEIDHSAHLERGFKGYFETLDAYFAELFRTLPRDEFEAIWEARDDWHEFLKPIKYREIVGFHDLVRA